MLRILHLTDAYAAGVRIYIDNLATSQHKAGHEVRVMALLRDDAKFDNPSELPESQYTFLGTNSFTNLVKMTKRLIGIVENYDYIHLHSSRMGAIGRIVALKYPKKTFLYTPHGYAFLRKDVSGWQRKLFRIIEASLSKVPNTYILCVGAREFSEAESIQSERIGILRALIEVPNKLVNFGRLSSSDKLRIAFMCRNTPAKDPEFFLKLVAASKLRAEYVWIGATRDEFEISLTPSEISFLGPLDHENALAELAKCNVLVVTSLWEGLPLNVVEAQMMGLLVVIRDTIEIPELIKDKLTGYTFSTIEQYSDILHSILLNDDLNSEIVLEASKNAMQLFSIELNETAWISSYQKAT